MLESLIWKRSARPIVWRNWLPGTSRKSGTGTDSTPSALRQSNCNFAVRQSDLQASQIERKNMALQAVEGFQISPLQHRLWKLSEAGDNYVASCRIQIEGRLDKGILRDALRLVVSRNGLLRMTFQHVAGLQAPHQVISDSESIDWNEKITQAN